MENKIELFQTEDGEIQIEVQLENETVWLSQKQLCILFEKSKNTISEHIRNVFKEGELEEMATVRKSRTVQMEGNRVVTRNIEH